MNILFMTLVEFDSLSVHSIYTDLLREFVKHGHEVYIISPIERRRKKKTYIVKEDHTTIIRLKIGNTQKTNVIEKGISTVLIEPEFIFAIKKYFSNVKFDLVLYSTPPITLVSAVEYVKKRDGAKSYLLLKDIFPQNAVDLGMMRKTGVRSVLYRYFRNQERNLYKASDRIGCMSQANVDYIIEHNSYIDSAKVEVCPNSIEAVDKSVEINIKKQIRKKYRIPLDKVVFVYGGNLGKPQGIPFLIECLKECLTVDNAYFLIVGDGTDYPLLEKYVNSTNQHNVKLMRRLPKEDYDTLVAACDIGMIFLDHRFTIPNFPSRLLSYMQAKLPVLAVTDPNTDVGKTIVDGGFGWWCESDDPIFFSHTIEVIANDTHYQKKEASFSYLLEHYTSETSYLSIIHSLFK